MQTDAALNRARTSGPKRKWLMQQTWLAPSESKNGISKNKFSVMQARSRAVSCVRAAKIKASQSTLKHVKIYWIVHKQRLCKFAHRYTCSFWISFLDLTCKQTRLTSGTSVRFEHLLSSLFCQNSRSCHFETNKKHNEWRKSQTLRIRIRISSRVFLLFFGRVGVYVTKIFTSSRLKREHVWIAITMSSIVLST